MPPSTSMNAHHTTSIEDLMSLIEDACESRTPVAGETLKDLNQRFNGPEGLAARARNERIRAAAVEALTTFMGYTVERHIDSEMPTQSIEDFFSSFVETAKYTPVVPDAILSAELFLLREKGDQLTSREEIATLFIEHLQASIDKVYPKKVSFAVRESAIWWSADD